MVEAFERALEATARSLRNAGSDVNERRFEQTLVEHLDAGVGDGWSAVRRQHGVRLESFPGVGPVDVVLKDSAGAPIALIELKWGRTFTPAHGTWPSWRCVPQLKASPGCSSRVRGAKSG